MAVDTYALCTLAQLKAYLDYTDTVAARDAILEDCIDAATYRIEQFCDRKLVAREYVEWHQCFDGERVQVRHWPLVYARAIGYGSKPAIAISSDTTGYVATVISVNNGDAPGTVVRRVDTSGTVTNTPQLFANYGTLALLATQLDGISGITATAVATGPSSYLIPTSGIDIHGTTTNLDMPSVVTSKFYYDSRTGNLTVKDSGSGWSDWIATGGPIMVVYKGGYETIPYDLEQACIEVAKELFITRRSDTGNAAGDFVGLPNQERIQEILQAKLAQRKEIR